MTPARVTAAIARALLGFMRQLYGFWRGANVNTAA
jgi:hypothetical protein